MLPLCGYLPPVPNINIIQQRLKCKISFRLHDRNLHLSIDLCYALFLLLKRDHMKFSSVSSHRSIMVYPCIPPMTFRTNILTIYLIISNLATVNFFFAMNEYSLSDSIGPVKINIWLFFCSSIYLPLTIPNFLFYLIFLMQR